MTPCAGWTASRTTRTAWRRRTVAYSAPCIRQVLARRFLFEEIRHPLVLSVKLWRNRCHEPTVVLWTAECQLDAAHPPTCALQAPGAWSCPRRVRVMRRCCRWLAGAVRRGGLAHDAAGAGATHVAGEAVRDAVWAAGGGRTASTRHLCGRDGGHSGAAGRGKWWMMLMMRMMMCTRVWSKHVLAVASQVLEGDALRGDVGETGGGAGGGAAEVADAEAEGLEAEILLQVPSWLKLKELATLVDSPLVDITRRWQEGVLAACGFAAQEIHGLICAIFEPTSLRKECLEHIQ
jgi:hypothetical protein